MQGMCCVRVHGVLAMKFEVGGVSSKCGVIGTKVTCLDK